MNRSASLCVVLSGVLWGVISVFIRQLSAAGLSALNISLIRMLIAAISFSVFVLIKDKSKFRIKVKDSLYFVGTGIVSVVLFNLCYFYTMIHSQASVAVVLLYTSPIFIMVISAFLFKERFTFIKTAALILTFSGCVLVSGVFGGGYRVSPLIMLTGLASGLFYALYTIFGRYALAKYDTLTVTVYTFIFGLIGSLFVGRPGETVSIISSEPKLLIWCLGIGVISTVLPYFLYTYGLNNMESGKAAILVAVEPLVGSVIGMVFYNESRSVLKICGIMLIFASIIILNMPTKDKASKESVTQ